MVEVNIRETPHRLTSSELALQALATADRWLITAKRIRSPKLVARAEQDLQAAVDCARDLGVQWGQIGSTLGIARGNAYQRYRKKLRHNDFQADDTQRTKIA